VELQAINHHGVNMTKFRKPLLVAMCVASLGTASIPLTSSAAVEVYFNAPPPPARVETVPAPRHGYVWAPGYWDLRGHRHVWVAGHWERERRGYVYNEPRWVQRDNRWYLERSHWARGDKDHDGVPNAVDRAPNNPTRQ
jgi:hypothetical protein